MIRHWHSLADTLDMTFGDAVLPEGKPTVHGMPLEARVRAGCMPDPSTGCWVWQKAQDGRGYGALAWGGRQQMAHRMAWEAFRGPIPDGLQIDHLCRNPKCVNPDHLEPVTPLENNLRSQSWAAVNARKTSCPKGHPYSGDNLVIETKPGGRLGRRCRTCRNEGAQQRGMQNRRRHAA